MKKTNVIAVIALAVSAAVLAGCTPRSAMSTLSAASDSETAEVFSLTKVLDLGTNYLVSLDGRCSAVHSVRQVGQIFLAAPLPVRRALQLPAPQPAAAAQGFAERFLHQQCGRKKSRGHCPDE